MAARACPFGRCDRPASSRVPWTNAYREQGTIWVCAFHEPKLGSIYFGTVINAKGEIERA